MIIAKLTKKLTHVYLTKLKHLSQYHTFFLFSRFFDLRGNLENIKDKATVKSYFFREKLLVSRIYGKNFTSWHFF